VYLRVTRNPQYGCPLTKHMSLAVLGSLNLEFIRLSIITDNPKYADAIGHVASEMARTQDNTSVPGLWPTTVDTSCAEGLCELTSNKYSLGESGDSTFEYVLKV
jgi:mannosyl-oligosaccharide alpha-1,2-mannosidase